MRFFSAAEIDAALTPLKMVEALRASFRSDVVAPKRHHHVMQRPDADATLLLMPAWSHPAAREAYSGVKVVSVFPGNAAHGVASVQGTYILMNGATGVPLAAMDGARLTLHRTAAASALAASYLARQTISSMVMVGAGALAGPLIRAHKSVRPSIKNITVWNHKLQRVPDFLKSLHDDPALHDIHFTVAEDLKGAVQQADLVSCATLSREPLVHGAWLKPGAHLDLVGSYNLQMREADDDALRCASIFVDTPACMTEGGDVAIGIKNGVIGEDAVLADFTALTRGTHKGRVSDAEITLFKSVGASQEDLAAAMAVWDHYRVHTL
ncbi:MAG: ornithine cyclodeaminase family protein [Beijerinckiaceae bacterium]